MGQTSIITGQHVRLEQTAASVLQRSVAWGIDLAVLFASQLLVWPLLLAVNAATHSDEATLILAFVLEIALSSYPLLMEVFNHGQTLGKRLLSIQVIRLDGTEPSVSDSLTRWLLLLIDFFYFIIGLVFIIFTKNSQRLGDLAAGTTVVKKHQYGELYFDLRDYEFASKNYHPQYKEAARLTPGQADLIQRSFWVDNWDLKYRLQSRLATKTAEWLQVDMGKHSDASFLRKVLSDYHYYESISAE